MLYARGSKHALPDLTKDGHVFHYLSLHKPFLAHGEDSLLLLTSSSLKSCASPLLLCITFFSVCTSSQPEQRCPDLASWPADDLVLLRLPGADGCSWSGRAAGVFRGAVEREGGRHREQKVAGEHTCPRTLRQGSAAACFPPRIRPAFSPSRRLP